MGTLTVSRWLAIPNEYSLGALWIGDLGRSDRKKKSSRVQYRHSLFLNIFDLWLFEPRLWNPQIHRAGCAK
jgi:hypothetical protein